MPIWTRKATRLITIRSRIALGLIALFVTASFVVTAWAVNAHRERLAVISYAAKQRMLSQRIPFLANELAKTADEELRTIYRGDLQRAVKGMERRHALLSLEKPLRLPAGTRAILEEAYRSDLLPFRMQVNRFLQYARQVLDEAGKGTLAADMPQLARLTDMGGGFVLETHELIYNLLRTDALRALARYISLASALWLATLGLLILEMPLIFRPMAGQTAQNMRMLDAARLKAEKEAAEAEADRDNKIDYMRVLNHEMRTPLNAVLGMAALLRMSGLPQKQDEYACQIQDGAQQLLDLINHVLDFREIESNLVRVKLGPLSLKDELERILAIFRPLAEEKGLEMGCDVDDDLAPQYHADGMRIRQVLTYLVGNAIKFTEKGSVTLNACLAGATEGNKDLVRFEVRDTGVGVAPELRERIFKEWQQAEGTMARRYGGVGLGLAISHRLVHLMNGEIGVESADGQGSVFWFVLPLERAGEKLGRPNFREAG